MVFLPFSLPLPWPYTLPFSANQEDRAINPAAAGQVPAAAIIKRTRFRCKEKSLVKNAEGMNDKKRRS
jgi:hypothetical protein